MLERLDDYFFRQSGRQGGERQRVWLSQIISRAIAEQLGVSSRAIIGQRSLTIYCPTQAAAVKLKFEQSRLEKLLTAVDQDLVKKRLAIRVEPPGYGPTV